jgi:hypothetical protein
MVGSQEGPNSPVRTGANIRPLFYSRAGAECANGAPLTYFSLFLGSSVHFTFVSHGFDDGKLAGARG